MPKLLVSLSEHFQDYHHCFELGIIRLFIYLCFNLIVKKKCILNDSLTIKLFYLDYFNIKYIYYMYIVKINNFFVEFILGLFFFFE